jgi:hypothetical protein
MHTSTQWVDRNPKFALPLPPPPKLNVHGETIVPYGRIAPISNPNFTQNHRDTISPFLCHQRAQVLRAPWPDHSGKVLYVSSVVLVAWYAREACRGNRLVNSAMIKWERELDVTVSAVHVGRPFSKCLSQIDEYS